MTAPVVVISDAGPLSYLHRLGRLDLLPCLFGRVVVPPAVVAEVAAGRALGRDLPDVTVLDWMEVQAPSAVALAGIVGLGAGETESLALARAAVGALLLLDDRAARRVAVSLGLQLTGTVGLLLLAKERRLIEQVAPELDRLQVLGFRLAESVRRAALDLAGERH